ncbi:cholesterol oxidase substrate-binding domain-containing protein [Nocardia jejuensis]|uniref:cholesterol oxidase substrate-binding domain-containing protein n=1 Tax=Nocardia jejuensis TaxID=328049 RepID=UPI000AFE0C77|nr:cholesterol oxidase substrate-binding domain-containing protein [Nocardia jejuensis]
MIDGNSVLPGRRAVLGGMAGAAAFAALGWTPAFRVPAARAESALTALPSGLEAYRQAYENWSGEVRIDQMWTCAPTMPQQVVDLANWARTNGWTLRARGNCHNWSPLTARPGESRRVLLVDTTRYLTAVSVHPGEPAAVTAQTGVHMETLMTIVERAGYGFTATPAPGDISLGGVLAIGGHGTGVPAEDETRTPGHTFGSISNLVVSLTAVVWDESLGVYALRTFRRDDPGIAPLLVNLGRTFVTEVTLRVGTNTRVRCRSYTDVDAETLFAPRHSAGENALTAWLDRSGRAEAIWFPFTDTPWLKVWDVAPRRPAEAAVVEQPFNYPFCDTIPDPITDLMGKVAAGGYGLTPALCRMHLSMVDMGLDATGTRDIWGWSKNTLLYVRPTTLKVTANGYAILTRRADVQRVVNEFYVYFRDSLARYAAQGAYPMNGPLEIRVTGLDDPEDVGIDGAVAPTLSAIRPRTDHADWDVAIWLDILTIPGTPHSDRFYRETEKWVLANYSGEYAELRPEWSKGWGYSDTAAWADPVVVGEVVPARYRDGLPAGNSWDTAVSLFERYDPHRVFSNDFLDTLLRR